MLYSVRMRAAQGADHQDGGRHISGAERLVRQEQVAEQSRMMLERAFCHSRGQADYIHITVERVPEEAVRCIRLLPVTTIKAADVDAGRKAAKSALLAAGVKQQAVNAGMEQLLALPDSMRGAMLLCAETGKRLDGAGERGVRVSRMDVADQAALSAWLDRQALNQLHVREAVVLAAKVASTTGIIAELCWSDDPEYTAGYVACSTGYTRLSPLKPYGSPQGGRVFFVQPGSRLVEIIRYLEQQPVLAEVPEEEF